MGKICNIFNLRQSYFAILKFSYRNDTDYNFCAFNILRKKQNQIIAKITGYIVCFLWSVSHVFQLQSLAKKKLITSRFNFLLSLSKIHVLCNLKYIFQIGNFLRLNSILKLVLTANFLWVSAQHFLPLFYTIFDLIGQRMHFLHDNVRFDDIVLPQTPQPRTPRKPR